MTIITVLENSDTVIFFCIYKTTLLQLNEYKMFYMPYAAIFIGMYD